MTRRTALVTTVFAAAVLFGWAGAFAAGQLKAKPTAVAVVDIELVFNQLKQKQSLEADMRSAAEGLQGDEKAKRARISDLQSQLDLLPPGSDAHRAKQEEVQMAVLDLQVWVQFQQQKMARERALQVETLYRKVISTIGSMAAESGYDVVLFKEATPKFEGANLQQIMAQVSIRKVLWSSDTIDLTDTVITRMNNEFDAAG